MLWETFHARSSVLLGSPDNSLGPRAVTWCDRSLDFRLFRKSSHAPAPKRPRTTTPAATPIPAAALVDKPDGGVPECAAVVAAVVAAATDVDDIAVVDTSDVLVGVVDGRSVAMWLICIRGAKTVKLEMVSTM